ncbi:MAG: 6-carboxytetrahydropterin synthase [Ignavibacteria bacterium]|nr:6-carboxytetrahydropterin synthase [Ignavibacteria bacterium]
MKLRIAKEFTWQMSHRLPFHKGLCSNIHGHTYRIRVSLVGVPDDFGMLIDFYELERIVKPLIEQLEHSFVVDKNDEVMIDFLKKNNFRFVIVPETTTSENLAIWISNQIAEKLKEYKNIELLSVRFYETPDSFAEYELALRKNEVK